MRAMKSELYNLLINNNNQIFKIKTMKNNYVKLSLLTLTMIAGTASVQAQDTNATIGKQAKATLGDVTTNVTE